jgi:hypothetical protein
MAIPDSPLVTMRTTKVRTNHQNTEAADRHTSPPLPLRQKRSPAFLCLKGGAATLFKCQHPVVGRQPGPPAHLGSRCCSACIASHLILCQVEEALEALLGMGQEDPSNVPVLLAMATGRWVGSCFLLLLLLLQIRTQPHLGCCLAAATAAASAIFMHACVR